jgi:hypothetical protein
MKIGISRIYYGGGRRWFTLRAACRAHAKSIIKTRWMSDGNGLGDEWPTERVERPPSSTATPAQNRAFSPWCWWCWQPWRLRR